MTESPLVAILGTRYRDFAIEEQVLAQSGARIVGGPGTDRSQILEVAGDAEVILAGAAPRFDAETLGALNCRGIVRYGVGTDSIDLAAARAHGMWVSRVPDYGTEAVATHAVALAMTAFRQVVEANRRVRAGHWDFAELRPLHLPSASVVGVVGYGRIGRHAARQFRGLGFKVYAFDPVAPVPEEDDVEASSLDDLLRLSDVVSLHLPGAPDGTALLDAERLARMKSGSVLVNTARGTVVDPSALREGLAAGRPGIAALDVLPVEPPDPTFWAGVENQLVLTPHMAWYTEESENDLRRKAAGEALRLLAGLPPIEVVAGPDPQEGE